MLRRNFEANVAQIVHRRKAMMRNLVDVKGELRLHMLVLAVRVVHALALTLAQFWKLDRYSKVRRFGMSDGVADVMGQSTHSEGQFVRVTSIAE